MTKTKKQKIRELSRETVELEMIKGLEEEEAERAKIICPDIDDAEIKALIENQFVKTAQKIFEKVLDEQFTEEEIVEIAAMIKNPLLRRFRDLIPAINREIQLEIEKLYEQIDIGLFSLSNKGGEGREDGPNDGGRVVNFVKESGDLDSF